MRKLVFIIFVATCIFTLNLGFYIFSEDYRFFIKKIKYSDEVVYDDNLEVNDTDTITLREDTGNLENLTSTQKSITPEDDFQFLEEVQQEKQLKLPQEVLTMRDTEKDVLALFEDYDLKSLIKHSSLFDITTEYPDEYFEYYSNDLALYFFSSKSYTQVFDIFEVLSYDLPYDINETNTFGQASFFINLKEVYTDEFVRLVVQYENKAF